MKKYILVIFIGISILPIYSQQIVPGFTEYFDLEDTTQNKYFLLSNDTLWYIGIPVKEELLMPPSFSEKCLYTGSSLFYPEGINASFQLKVNLEGEGNTKCFGFDHLFDFEPNIDGGLIETSYDNGSSWQNIIYDNHIMDNLSEIYNFYSDEDTIQSFIGQPGFTGGLLFGENAGICWFESDIRDTITIRFTIASDTVNSENEGWLLDNINFWTMVEDRIMKNIYQRFLKIVPNPASDNIRIESDISETITAVKIFSPLGHLVYSDDYSGSINICGLVPGMYVIRCYSDMNNVYTSKFSKE